MIERVLPDALPAVWLADAEARCDCDVPATLSEPEVECDDVDAEVDEVIAAVRRDIFPRHGLSAEQD